MHFVNVLRYQDDLPRSSPA